MKLSTTTVVLAACAVGTLALAGCGPKAASGEITRLEQHDAWIETDCVIESGEPTCEASPEQDCNLVVFNDGTYEYSDCIGQDEWERLKVGDTYTDRDDDD